MKWMLLWVVNLSCYSLFSQFTVCNSGTNEVLNDVHFVNEEVGFAVGYSGIFLRSVDGGENWNTLMEIDSVVFFDVAFWDDANGMIVGDKVIYTTSDTGQNWSKVNHPAAYFLGLELLSNKKAILTTANGEVYRFSHEDNELVTISTQLESLQFNHISFPNDSVGFASFQDGSLTRLYSTENGGQDWEEVILESDVNVFSITEDLVFITPEIGYRGGWYNSTLQKTIDGGKHWSYVTNPDEDWEYWAALYDFHIPQNSNGSYYACGWYRCF